VDSGSRDTGKRRKVGFGSGDHRGSGVAYVYGRRVHLVFVGEGVVGRVTVDAVVNEDPAVLGRPLHARGMEVDVGGVCIDRERLAALRVDSRQVASPAAPQR
jgi:hypothetical protein